MRLLLAVIAPTCVRGDGQRGRSAASMSEASQCCHIKIMDEDDASRGAAEPGDKNPGRRWRSISAQAADLYVSEGGPQGCVARSHEFISRRSSPCRPLVSLKRPIFSGTKKRCARKACPNVKSIRRTVVGSSTTTAGNTCRHNTDRLPAIVVPNRPWWKNGRGQGRQKQNIIGRCLRRVSAGQWAT